MLLELVGRSPLLRKDLRTKADDNPDLVIDARRLRFVSPLDLTAIAALANGHATTSRAAALVLPAHAGVTSYVQRMNLLDNLPAATQVVGVLPFDDRRDLMSTLFETRFLTPGTAGSVSECIGRLAAEGLGAHVGRRVSAGIGELIDNAITHGLANAGAFIAAQTYSGRTTGCRRLEVAICDTGMGVLKHLRGSPAHKDICTSKQALRRALEPGVSGTGERRGRGNGLPDLLIKAGGTGSARLVLRSGDGLLYAGQSRSGFSATRCHTSPSWVQGTWAWLRVSFTS